MPTGHIKPKKAGEPIPNHRWYKNEQFDYELYSKLKGKVTAYFKIESGRWAGRRKIKKYVKVYESGFTVSLDMTMFKLGVNQGFSTPFSMLNSNKREFDSQLKIFLKHIL